MLSNYLRSQNLLVRREPCITGPLDDVVEGEWESHDSRDLGNRQRDGEVLSKVVLVSCSTKPGPPRPPGAA